MRNFIKHNRQIFQHHIYSTYNLRSQKINLGALSSPRRAQFLIYFMLDLSTMRSNSFPSDISCINFPIIFHFWETDLIPTRNFMVTVWRILIIFNIISKWEKNVISHRFFLLLHTLWKCYVCEEWLRNSHHHLSLTHFQIFSSPCLWFRSLQTS